MIGDKLIDDLREYLKNYYIPAQKSQIRDIEIERSESSLNESGLIFESVSSEKALARKTNTVYLGSVSDEAFKYLNKNRKPGGFAYALEQKRKDKGLKPAELYKKANIDRRLYSRLMGPDGRNPSKNTVISFALALQLDLNEFSELLQAAGYALSSSSSRDVCVMFCLEKGIYGIDDVNALLFTIGIEPLTRDVE